MYKKVIVKFKDDKEVTYDNVRDIVIYPDGDKNTKTYASIKVSMQKEVGYNSYPFYYNIYEKPESIRIME
jgi:hypothetical protein